MKKKILNILIPVLTVYIIWAVVIPFLININANHIENYINTNFHTNLKIKHPKISTASVIRLKFSAENIILKDKKNNIVLNTEKPCVSIKLLPLLIGKCHIKSFEADNININFTLDKNIYLAEFPIELNNKFDTKFDRIKTNRYKIILTSKKQPSVTLKGNNIYYKNTLLNIYLKGSNELVVSDKISYINSDMKISKKRNLKTSKLFFEIKNLDITPFTELIKIISKNRIHTLNGKINIFSDNGLFDCNICNLKILNNDFARSFIFPEELIIKSEYLIKSNILILNNLNIKSKNNACSVKGEVNNIISKKPKLNLSVDIPHLDFREVALMLPPIVTPAFNVYRLKKNPMYGDINGKLRIKNKLPEPDIYGRIVLKNVYIINPIKNAKKATIDIKFIKDYMDIDAIAFASDKEAVYVTGTIEDYGEYSTDLRIRSTKHVDLRTAKSVIDPLHEILRFLIGPVPIMGINGVGNINIRVIGPKKEPHIWGEFNFIDTSTSFNDMSTLLLEHATGKVTFDDQMTHFINETGTVRGQPFKIDGKCSLSGNLDYDISGQNQPLALYLKLFSNDKMVKPVKKIIPDIKNPTGNVDLKLHLNGKIPDIYKINLGKNIKAKGSIILKNNSLIFNEIPIQQLTGIINFDNFDIELNLNSMFDNISKMNITGNIKNDIADLKIFSDKLNIKHFTQKTVKELDDLYVKVNLIYKGETDTINLSKLEGFINVLPSNKPVKNIKIETGNINIKHSKLEINNITGQIKQSPFAINLAVNNIDNLKKIKINADIKAKKFNLVLLNSLKNIFLYFPQNQNIRQEINRIKIISGITDINIKITNNKINSLINFSNINFAYNLALKNSKTPLFMPVKVINGEVFIKNNRVFLNKINCIADDMPVLVYGNISDILKKPKFFIHVNSKLIQKIFDKYYNIYAIYPIKLKGDIILGSLISGEKDNINIKADLKLEEQSSLYYLGAIIGDIENDITANIDCDILKNNSLRLNSFQYGKLITSQNNTQSLLPIVLINGGITYYKNLCVFDNLNIKTEIPCDARIFNIIFKKSMIKSGQFVSNIKLNGTSFNPEIIGTISFNSINIPFLNSKLKKLSCDFKNDNVILNLTGDVLNNAVKMSAKVKNEFGKIVEIKDADVNLKYLNLNNLISQIQEIELQSFLGSQTNKSTQTENIINTDNIIIDNLEISADDIEVKNLNAKNLKAKCSLNKNLFNVDNFSFGLDDGRISGKVQYNLLSSFVKLKLYSTDIDANKITIAILDLPNQIYGKLSGLADITTDLTNDKTSKSALSGHISFSVKDGRMPQLGSMEYFLKAGNLIRSGITGVTINSIIDILTPLKSGEFSVINGNINISNGIADNIKIYSKSDDLLLLIRGRYIIPTSVADILVVGQLSRKISTIFGAIGNLSINSLFNTIPGVDLSKNGQLTTELNRIPGLELSSKVFRKFVVEINGDLEDSNSVKTFKWVN